MIFIHDLESDDKSTYLDEEIGSPDNHFTLREPH